MPALQARQIEHSSSRVHSQKHPSPLHSPGRRRLSWGNVNFVLVSSWHLWFFTSSFGARGIRNWEGRAGSLAGGSRTPLPAPAILAGAMRRAAWRRCLVQTSLCALARKALIKGNEVTGFFGRYILSARSLRELSGGACAQSRPRLYSFARRTQPHSVFFQDQGPPPVPPPAPAGRWADDPEMLEESAWILFPVSCFLLTVGSGSLDIGGTTRSRVLLRMYRG